MSELLNLLRTNNFIVVHKSFARNIGLVPAALFYEIASRYFYFKQIGGLKDFQDKKTKKFYSGYFYYTVDDLYNATGVKKTAQASAIKDLVKLGLIDHQNKKLKNDEHQKRYFKIIASDELLLKYTKDYIKESKNDSESIENTRKSENGFSKSAQEDFLNIHAESIENSENQKSDFPKDENGFSKDRNQIFQRQKSANNKTYYNTNYKTKDNNNNNTIGLHNTQNIENENKSVVVVNEDDIKYLQNKFKEILQPYLKTSDDMEILNINDKDMKKLIEKNSIDKILKYLNNHKGFNITDNPVGFMIKAINGNWKPSKGKIKHLYTNSTNNNNKPVQSTNFEQREYDDEFFESLYDNF